MKRPIVKLCPLPVSHIDENNTAINKNPQQRDSTSQQNAQEKSSANKKTSPAKQKRGTKKGQEKGKLTNKPNQAKPNEPKQAETTTPKQPSKAPNTTKRYNLRNRNKISSFTLCLAILMASAAVILGQAPYKITSFDSKPGIFFEEIGKAKLINDIWDLIIYYNLTNYWRELDNINTCINKIKELKNSMHHPIQKEYFGVILEELEQQRREIDANNDLLYHYKEGKFSNRRKRAPLDEPLDIVGTIVNELFGILDQRFAKQYDESIENIKGNETTHNVIKRDEIQMEKQIKIIDDQLSILTRNANNFSLELTSKMQTEAITTLTIHTLILSNSYQRMQDAQMDITLDTQHGKFNTLIIKPTQLRQQLKAIEGHIPPNLAIPANNELDIYALMKTRVRAINNKLIFRVSIPLIQRETFQIFKPIPVPTSKGKEFIYIEPTMEYLLVNLPRTIFCPLNTRELDQCETQGARRLHCTTFKKKMSILRFYAICGAPEGRIEKWMRFS